MSAKDFSNPEQPSSQELFKQDILDRELKIKALSDDNPDKQHLLDGILNLKTKVFNKDRPL